MSENRVYVSNRPVCRPCNIKRLLAKPSLTGSEKRLLEQLLSGVMTVEMRHGDYGHTPPQAGESTLKKLITTTKMYTRGHCLACAASITTGTICPACKAAFLTEAHVDYIRVAERVLIPGYKEYVDVPGTDILDYPGQYPGPTYFHLTQEQRDAVYKFAKSLVIEVTGTRVFARQEEAA